ncbi:hypothetical protein VTL71DRAFT_9746 [Oculimacula yallundae]|uniref:Zn(2)-C6 fungal-type domain-containing protein n=1 Tax=Oculimacula yallundae TaxID=86028 RepID=A0ABR4BT26_9HELO
MRSFHKKTRAGCQQCKARKVKCNENKPICKGCKRQDLKCSFQFLVPTIPRSRQAPEISGPNRDVCLRADPILSYDVKSLEFLHHYHQKTSTTLGRAGKMDVWLVIIPRIALSHEFLMHGLLAVSALHLSMLQPSRREELVEFASKSESLALPTFRELVRRNSPSDISAVFAFAGFVIPYMLAMSGVLGVSDVEIPSPDKPHWFLMARGLIHLLTENWMAIEQGPFASVLESTSLPVDNTWNPDDAHLAGLQTSWEKRSANNKVVDEALDECIKTLDQLRRVSCLPFAPSQSLTIMSAVYYWPGNVSSEYMQLIYDKWPEALIVLAHYCVLLKQADWVWFLRGVGQKLLISIEKELDTNWKPFIKWALEQPCR